MEDTSVPGGASGSKYVPSIERMKTYCFKQTYRLCPALSEYLYENDMAMANYLPKKPLNNLFLIVPEVARVDNQTHENRGYASIFQ